MSSKSSPKSPNTSNTSHRNIAFFLLFGLPILLIGMVFALMRVIGPVASVNTPVPAPPNAAVIPPPPVSETITLSATQIGLRRKKALPDTITLDGAQEAVTNNPNDAKAQKTLGMIQFNAELYREAVPHLEQAMMKSPSDAEARLYLGYARLGVGDLRNAIGDIEAAVLQEENPLPKSQKADGWLEIGNAAYKALGDDPLAAKSFRECLDLDPKRGEAALALGTWYATAGKKTEAEKLFLQARDSSSANSSNGGDLVLKSQAEACLKRLSQTKTKK